MNRNVFILIATFALGNSAFALTDAGKEALKKLSSAMEAEMNKGKQNPGEFSGRDRIIYLENILANGADQTQNFQQLENAISQAVQGFQSAEVAESLVKLKSELRVERDAAVQAELASLKDIIQRATEQTRKAKEPADLDDVISELGKFENTGYQERQSEEIQRARQQISALENFVTSWQDYLAAIKRDDRKEAQQILSVLSGKHTVNIFPRSELLSLRDEINIKTGEAAEVVNKIQSLAEISSAIEALTKLKQLTSNSSSEVDSYIRALAPIEKNYRDFLNGFPISLELSNYSYGSVDTQNQAATAKLSELKMEVFKLALPRYVNAPKGTAANDGENLLDFMDRLEAEAKEREDPGVGLRVRETRKLLTRGNTFSSQDIEGINYYNSGQNQEAAGQLVMAVAAYQQALNSGSDLVPAKSIGKQLEGIKARDPDAYVKGIERYTMTMNSPFDGQYPPRFGPRGERPEKPAPALLIPAPKEAEESKKDAPKPVQEKK